MSLKKKKKALLYQFKPSPNTKKHHCYIHQPQLRWLNHSNRAISGEKKWLMGTWRHLIMFSTLFLWTLNILCSLPTKKKSTCLITALPHHLRTPLAWKSFQHFQSPSSWEILLLTFGTPKEQPTVRQQEIHQTTNPLTSPSEQSAKLFFFLSAVFESPCFQVPLN